MRAVVIGGGEREVLVELLVVPARVAAAVAVGDRAGTLLESPPVVPAIAALDLVSRGRGTPQEAVGKAEAVSHRLFILPRCDTSHARPTDRGTDEVDRGRPRPGLGALRRPGVDRRMVAALVRALRDGPTQVVVTGDGPTVVLLPSLPGLKETWIACAAGLARAGSGS